MKDQLKKCHRLLVEGALLPVKFYRRCISPYIGPHCKYRPTCSQYALQAVREWGVFAGGALTVWRLLRCNPFSKGGYDPVPRRKK